MPPRSRNTRIKKAIYDKVSDDALWYVKLDNLVLVVIEGYTSEEGFGPEIDLVMSRVGGRSFVIGLCEFTVAELNVFREIIDKAITLAEPIVKGRDERAAKLFEESKGDTVFKRLYRGIPRLVERSRAVGLDGQSLLLRPVDVPIESVE